MVFAFTPLVCVCVQELGLCTHYFWSNSPFQEFHFTRAWFPIRINWKPIQVTFTVHMKNVHWPSLNRIFAELCGLSSLVLFGILKDPPKRDSHFRPAATEAWGTGFPWMVPYPALAPAWWLFFRLGWLYLPHVRFRSTYIFYNTINYYVL